MTPEELEPIKTFILGCVPRGRRVDPRRVYAKAASRRLGYSRDAISEAMWRLIADRKLDRVWPGMLVRLAR